MTGARLHFGLLDVRPPFGGAGIMIVDPATEVIASRADRFDPGNIQPDRITAIARRWAGDHGDRWPSVAVSVPRCSPSHCGLGSGTQLCLAVAEAIDRATGGQPRNDQIQHWAGRGLRSAVGSIGYRTGGLVVEDAANGGWHEVVALPEPWRIALLTPRVAGDPIAGSVEKSLFKRLPMIAPATRNQLRQRLIGDMLPAARVGNFKTFAAAVSDYNRRSGELFAAAQGGPYSPAATATIDRLKRLGVQHFGQSSWGPGVFAWFPDELSAGQFAGRWDGAEIDCQITRVVPVNADVPLPGRGRPGGVN